MSELDERIKRRKAYQSTFSSEAGQAVLADILNHLGYFSCDPSIVRPELAATANWILNSLGVVTVENLPDYIKAIVSSANNADLTKENDNE